MTQSPIAPGQLAVLRAIDARISELEVEVDARGWALGFGATSRQDTSERRELQSVGRGGGCILRFAILYGRPPTKVESAGHARTVRRLLELGHVSTNRKGTTTYIDLTESGRAVLASNPESDSQPPKSESAS